MTNPDEGMLRAWLDGELTRAEANELEDRMDRDRDTRSALEEMRARETRASALLATLDVDEAAAAERVRAVLRGMQTVSPRDPLRPRPSERRRIALGGADPGASPSGWTRMSRLAQAAILVLLFAGAAAAAIAPGSPVRSWLVQAMGPDPVEAPTPYVGSSGPGEAGGLIVSPGRSRFEIDLVAVPEGAEILITLVPGDTAAVYAPAGSEYEWDAEVGRARAEVGGGPIHLEIPEAMDFDLFVNDRVYLSQQGDRMELPVTPTDRSTTEIRFRAGN